MQFGQIHHVEYYVKDLARSNTFWNWFMPFMGYEKYQSWDQGLSWRHATGTYIVFVQIVPTALQIENDRQGNGLNHIAFNGKNAEHAEQLLVELQKRQIRVLRADERYICFEDPNNFAVEIYIPKA